MRTSLIGGDVTHRGLFGGRISKVRIWTLSIALVAGLLAAALWQITGLVLLAVLPLVAWFVTIDTVNNTVLQRSIDKRSYRDRDKRGLTTFVPYDKDGWDALTDAWANADGRAARKEAERQMHAMRLTPDGVEGMLWLRERNRTPGIQWHRPSFGEEYLAVVFSTTGQVEGIESDAVFDASAAGYEQVLAQFGAALTLPNRVQTISRILPSDPALHEAWLAGHGDNSIPDEIHESYREVVDDISAAQLVNRPMFVVCWPVTDRFVARAERAGEGIDGWLAVMDREIRSVTAAFTAARFRNVHAMTARQTAAVLRHLQHPGFPMDQAGDITPDRAWLPSQEDWSYMTYVGAPEGRLSQSLSRTCRVTAKDVKISHRTSLWMAPMLGEMEHQVVRTISFHLELTPQDHALFLAEKDRVSDIADANRRARGGGIEDATLTVEQEAAKRRIADLTPGTGYTGANWVGYITVTAGSRQELSDAVEEITAAASNAGISKLTWLDPHQQTAAAYTWPVGRGIAPSNGSIGTRVEKLAAGKEAKEAL